MERVRVRQATRQGWIWCDVGGVFDGQYPGQNGRRGRAIAGGQVSPALQTGESGVYRVERWRIRKITEREAWRLMGFRDADFEKAAAVNSKSQLYRQAGNAIVKGVLMAIFSQMNIKGVRRWNDMAEEERDSMIHEGIKERGNGKV